MQKYLFISQDKQLLMLHNTHLQLVITWYTRVQFLTQLPSK